MLLTKNFVTHFHHSATEKIVSRARQLVNVKKDDGFAALHLAALNGHREVADTLITMVMSWGYLDLIWTGMCRPSLETLTLF